MKRMYLGRAATAHLTRPYKESLMIRVVPLKEGEDSSIYDLTGEDGFMGRILFDEQGYWIYDGNDLTVEESEKMAEFILRNTRPEYSY